MRRWGKPKNLIYGTVFISFIFLTYGTQRNIRMNLHIAIPVVIGMIFISSALRPSGAACTNSVACGKLNTQSSNLGIFTYYCCSDSMAVNLGTPSCAFSLDGGGPYSDSNCTKKGYASQPAASIPPPMPPPATSKCPSGDEIHRMGWVYGQLSADA